MYFLIAGLIMACAGLVVVKKNRVASMCLLAASLVVALCGLPAMLDYISKDYISKRQAFLIERGLCPLKKDCHETAMEAAFPESDKHLASYVLWRHGSAVLGPEVADENVILEAVRRAEKNKLDRVLSLSSGIEISRVSNNITSKMLSDGRKYYRSFWYVDWGTVSKLGGDTVA